MPRINVNDLPVSVDLTSEEMQAVAGGGPHVKVFDGATGFEPMTDLAITDGTSNILIGMLLPAVQKVR